MNRSNHKISDRIAVYTAIFGQYDDLMGPLMKVPGCDFFCFTDDKDLRVPGFTMIYKKREFDDPTRDARMCKCLAHKFLPEYAYTLWVDGSLIIKDPRIAELVKKSLENSDMAAFKHRERSCIYKELEICIEQKKDNSKVMREQVESYKKEGYPENFGLAETGVLIRRKTKSIIKHNEMWWEEIQKHSKRDQLSFNYVLWKQKIIITNIEGNAEFNPFFYWHAIHGSKLGILGPAFDSLVEEKKEELEQTKHLYESSEKRLEAIHRSRFWKIRNTLAKWLGRSEF